MIQALILREGRADFRNRWVRTPKYRAEERAGRALFEWSDGGFGDWRSWGLGEVTRDEFTAGVPQGTNAVNVVPFAGEILALGEQGSPPVALDPITLETRGVVGWSTALSPGLVPPACFGDASFTAHPKWDAATGELFGWTYRDTEPYVTLHWVRPDGSVRSRHLENAPYATVAHDMWLSERYVVMPFMPFHISKERIAKDLPIWGWDPELPVVVALVPRSDLMGEVRWVTAGFEAQYVMHTLSANHVGDTLVAGAGLCREPAVRAAVEEGPARVRELIELGAEFTRDATPLGYHLTREGGHSQRRVLHAADMTGREVERALLAAADRAGIRVAEEQVAIDLVTAAKLGAGGRDRAPFRERLNARGLARFEVLAPDADRALIRSLAKRLAENGADATRIRATVHRTISGEPPKKGGILAALRRSPLVGADLDLGHSATQGRKVDL